MTKTLIGLFALLGIGFCLNAQESNRMIVSLGDFENKTNIRDGIYVTLIDRMTNAIVNTRKFEVIDNARLAEVLKEREKINAGITQETLEQNIAIAGYKIYGTITAFGVEASQVRGEGFTGRKTTIQICLNVRFADVETGKLCSSKEVKVAMDRNDVVTAGTQKASNSEEMLISDAIVKVSQEVTNELMELAYPVKVVAVSPDGKIVSLNIAKERAKQGAVYKINALGEEMIDEDTNESLGRDEVTIAEVIITDIYPKFAKAQVAHSIPESVIQKGMIARLVTETELTQRVQQHKQQQKREFLKRW